MLGMKDAATVYTRGTGGDWNVVHKNALRCRLAHSRRSAETTSGDRAELAARRVLIWDDTDYQMPAQCQVEVDGLRWNPLNTNAFEAFSGPGGRPIYKRIDVRRAA